MADTQVAPVTVPEEPKPLTEQEIRAQLQKNYQEFIADKEIQDLMNKAGIKAAQVRIPTDPDVQKLPNKSPLRQKKFSKLTKEQQELVTKANEQGLAIVIPVDGKDFGFMPTKEQRDAAAVKTANSQTETDARAQAESEKKGSFAQWWDDNSWWLKPVIFMLIGAVLGAAVTHALDKKDNNTASGLVETLASGLGGIGGGKEDTNTNTNGGGGNSNNGGENTTTGGDGTGVESTGSGGNANNKGTTTLDLSGLAGRNKGKVD